MNRDARVLALDGRYFRFKRVTKALLVLLASMSLTLAYMPAASAGTTSSSHQVVANSNSAPEVKPPSSSLNPPKTVGTDDVAGQYYSFCIWWNGTSALWTNNDPYSCEGWLDVYINGQQVAHLQNGGKPLATISCQLSAATGIMTIFTGVLNSGWAVAGWLWSSWVSGLGCR